MMRWSVVVLLLLSSLVPSLDALRIVHHARLERQQVLAASADLVFSDASAVVDAGAGAGAGVGNEAFRIAFCAVWGAIGARGAGYFAFSSVNAQNLNAPPHVFWVPTAVAACPANLQVNVANCGVTCVGVRADFNNILNLPHIHFANYAAATASAELRLSLKNRCTNAADFHYPPNPPRLTSAQAVGLATNYGAPVLAAVGPPVVAAVPGIGCTINPAHAHATAAITAWNLLFA